MSNLIELQSQIEKLQKQAGEIKAREFDNTVRDILAKMAAFGITVKDLQPGKGRTGKGRGKQLKGKPSGKLAVAGVKKKTSVTVPAKYRGPNGEGWSGRGLMPRWMTALLAQGRTKEEFSVKM